MVHLVRVEYIHFLYENQILHVTDVLKVNFVCFPTQAQCFTVKCVLPRMLHYS